MNGSRGRGRDDDDDDQYDQGKRVQVQQQHQGPNHYDIYALPSFVPPSPLLASPATHYQSCSLVVVNRAAGLATGLGLRLGLACAPDAPAHLVPTSDPGFVLAREAGHDPARAVLLGWVEEERLVELEALVRACDVPHVCDPPLGGEVLEWLLGVGRRLEYEGILSNPELLLGDVLQRR